MGAVDTTYTFTATDTITSTKMNNIIDQTTMTNDAIWLNDGLEVASGKIRITGGGITSSKLATGSVTSNAILDGTIVNDDINASAAIAGTKIAPNFGAQTVTAGLLNVNGSASSYTVVNLENTSGVQVHLNANGNTEGNIRTVTNHPLTLSTNNTERMRITSSGNVGIGKTNPSTPLDVNGTVTATAFVTASDYRLKEECVILSDGLVKVNALKPTNFKWIGGGTSVNGFIAHEVQAIVPDAIIGEKDAIDLNGNPIYQKIDQLQLIPILVAAIQELSQKVAELEAK